MATYDNYKSAGAGAARDTAGTDATAAATATAAAEGTGSAGSASNAATATAAGTAGAQAKRFGHGPDVIAVVLGAVVMIAMLLVICVSVNGAGVATVTVTTMGVEEGANATEEAALAAREATIEPVVAVYSGDVMEKAIDGTLSEEVPLFTTEVPLNRTVTLDKLTTRGTYTLVMNVTPQLEDGTAFLTPDPQVIEMQGNNVDAQFLMVEMPQAAGTIAQAQQAAEEAAENATAAQQ